MIPHDVEGTVELHEVSGAIHGKITDSDATGIYIARSAELGTYEMTLVPWDRIRHVTWQERRRP